MNANIYQLFRFITGDSVYPYTIVDQVALKYLNQAIDKLSSVVEYTFTETKTVTQTDIDNGYFELTHEIIQITSGLYGVNQSWQYGGGKKIRLLTTAFPAGDYTITYRARYVKFPFGTVLAQTAMDLPEEAEMPVVLYALGLYNQGTGVFDANGGGSIGNVKEKQEENMRVQFGLDGAISEELSSPAKMMAKAVSLMQDLPMAQDGMFSVFTA